MSRARHSKRTVGVLAVSLAAAITAAVLAAAAIAGLTSQSVAADFTNIHFRVVNSAASDLDSGWHTHPGLAIVQVQKGSLQITQGSCTPKTVGPGETLIEVPYVPVRGVATGQVVWTTTFLARYEDPVTIPLTTTPPCP